MKKLDRIELFQEWYRFLLDKGIYVRYAHLAILDKNRLYKIGPLFFFYEHGVELSHAHPEHYKTFQAVRRLKGKPHELLI
jgi:hypothetical protein